MRNSSSEAPTAAETGKVRGRSGRERARAGSRTERRRIARRASDNVVASSRQERGENARPRMLLRHAETSSCHEIWPRRARLATDAMLVPQERSPCDEASTRPSISWISQRPLLARSLFVYKRTLTIGVLRAPHLRMASSFRFPVSRCRHRRLALACAAPRARRLPNSFCGERVLPRQRRAARPRDAQRRL